MNDATQFFNTTAAGGYQIQRSLRFNSADSAYLSRTPASAGNRKTWTWAGWVKRSKLGITNEPFWSTNSFFARFSDDSGGDRIRVYNASPNLDILTSAVFRDPSAWYHVVLACDTSQVTASDRMKIYINNIKQVDFVGAVYPAQDTLLECNSNGAHQICQGFNGYLADVHFIDGQALDPTSFGEFDANGVWQPTAYSGTYGTNGFHLPFSDNSTAAALGTDTSGNSNTWTVNNISVAAGSDNDSLVDTPTNYGEDTGVGGEVRGNYATFNPLDKTNQYGSGLGPLSNGNLELTAPAGVQYTAGGNIVLQGKTYAEFTGLPGNDYRGLRKASTGDIYLWWNTNFYRNGTNEAVGVTYTSTDIIGIAYDASNGTLQFYKNGALAFTKTIPVDDYIHFVTATTGTIVANFGQRPFAYTAPSGYKALCTTNLPAPVVAQPSTVMDVKLYTGNSSTQTISGLGFSPDFVWLKARSAAERNVLFDQVRGAGYRLLSDGTESEALETNTLSAFTSDGFSLGVSNGVNGSGTSMVAWTWDAGSSTVTNTQGSITSSVRANASAGFSIVTFTYPSSGSFTVGHGLSATPGLIITKHRTRSVSWFVYHSVLGKDQRLSLDTTGAAVSDPNFWGSAAISSTTFGGSTGTSGISGDEDVAYCFAPVEGYSAFGSYTGNGSSDGPFVYTGFRPRWVLTKRTNTSGENWIIWDSARNPANTSSINRLLADLSQAEISNYTVGYIDALSNGYKPRGNWSALNQSGDTYVYAAFAESPFQYARAR